MPEFRAMLWVALLFWGAAARVRLDESAQFRGSDGRVQIFHGLNVVQKNFPWHPSTGEFDAFASLNHEDMTNLKAWGFNVIRLGVMWPGVEPAAGQYNQTYLKVMRKLVDDLYSHGIWTIVDFHQDAFTERYCGEGVPDWLLPMLEPVERKCKGALPKIFKFLGQCKSFEDYNYSTDPETGFPNTSECLSVGFDMYSRAPEVVSSWGNFFAYEAVQAKFRSFWQKVTEAFVGSEGVLGYDLVNEPLNGDYFRDARLFEPGHADKNLLQPMYESVGKVIRAVDPDAILMYEPAPFPDTVPAYVPGLGGVKPVGFDAGPADATHQALSYHIYSCGFAIDTCSRKGDPPSTDCHVCDDMAASAVAARDSDAKRLGGAAFLTEFGACSGTDTCVAEITRVTDLADQALHSWAYWQFKYNHDITTVAGPEEGFYGLEGQLQEKKVAALSRTFAPHIAGRPTAMRYSDTGAFRLSYVLESATRGLTTEIYLNEKMNYPSGFRVHVLNGTASSAAGRVQVTSENSAGAVDVALVRNDPKRAQEGGFLSKGDGFVKWQSSSAPATTFELSAESNITWWKGLKVIADSGDVLCDLGIQDGEPPARCELPGVEQHELLFSYKVELWKAKWPGHHHQLVDVLPATFLGPLLQQKVSFHWASEKQAQSALATDRAFEVVI